MEDDSSEKLAANLRKELEFLERNRSEVQKAFRAAAELQNSLNTSDLLASITGQTSRHDDLTRAITGPASDLARLASDVTGYWEDQTQQISEVARKLQAGPFDVSRELAGQFEDRFTVPAIPEIHQLTMELAANKNLLGAFTKNFTDFSHIQTQIEQIQSPWIDSTNRLASFAALAELHSLGVALQTSRPFDDVFTDILRRDLGDWRDRIVWPSDVETDLVLRARFYVGRGFNAALTEFPSMAFEVGLDQTGLRQTPPDSVAAYAPPVGPSEDPDQEADFKRTNMVQDWILRFETRVRDFIDRLMTQAFGSDWPSERLPNGLYDKWMEKKRKLETGTPCDYPMICYADFTDYVEIICRRDNWRTVFSVYFSRPESVRESFQRLYLPRVTAMHSRPILQEDQLLIHAEILRLMRVFLR